MWRLTFPNVFTPNNDGFNDVYYAYTENDNIEEFYMIIFDRLGEKVFASSSIDVGWDGTFKGMPMNTGVFILNVKVKNMIGEMKEYTQTIKLVR